MTFETINAFGLACSGCLPAQNHPTLTSSPLRYRERLSVGFATVKPVYAELLNLEEHLHMARGAHESLFSAWSRSVSRSIGRTVCAERTSTALWLREPLNVDSAGQKPRRNTAMRRNKFLPGLVP
jgi:hypothetical protein